MDKDSENKFRLRLQTELRALSDAEDSAKDSRATVELDQSAVGRLSRMDALQAQAMAKASSRRRLAASRKIEAALRRIDKSEFGYCTDCGNAIALARLELDPSVATCVECAP